MAKKEITKRRFYRSNLETIVWDPDEDKPMADFSKGHFTTDDKRVADYLEALGYVEIPLDAQEPPNIIVQKPTHVIDGNVPVMANGQAPIAFDKNIQRAQGDASPVASAVEQPAEPPVVKTAPADRPKAPETKGKASKPKAKKPAKRVSA